MGKPVYITVSQNQPGYYNSLTIRLFTEDGSYDRYCGISNINNKASQLQMFKSLIQMCKTIAAPVKERQPKK